MEKNGKIFKSLTYVDRQAKFQFVTLNRAYHYVLAFIAKNGLASALCQKNLMTNKKYVHLLWLHTVKIV